jgi:hypothetical protein
MDVSRLQITRPDFKDLKQGLNSQHLFAEVVLVEKSPNGSKPMLYQFVKGQAASFDDLYILRQKFIKLPHPAFLPLGTILEINMARKVIFMNNNNVVTYKCLLIIASLEHEFQGTTVFQALKDAFLLDAINVKDKMSIESLPPSKFTVNPYKKNHIAHTFNVPNASISRHCRSIAKLVQNKITDPSPHTLNHNLNNSINKLCFLQM